MSHDKPGPNEIRLRELREARERRARTIPGPRKLIPYAGHDETSDKYGNRYSKGGARKGKKK